MTKMDTPLHICLKCTTHLNTFSTFKRRSLDCNNQTENSRNIGLNTNATNNENSTVKSEIIFIKEEYIEENDSSTNKINMQQNSKKRSCNYIENNFEGSSSKIPKIINEEMIKETSIEEIQIKEEIEENNKYNCSYCNQDQPNFIQLRKHMKKHFQPLPDKKNVQCLNCHSVITCKNVSKHILQHINTTYCYVCSKKFPQKSNYLDHLKTCHEVEEISIEFEDKEDTSDEEQEEDNYDVTKDIELIVSDKNKCPICNEKFVITNKLILHVKKHTTVDESTGKSECPICKKKVIYIHKHLITHYGMKLYKCTSCKKSYTTNRKLRCHVAEIHEKDNRKGKSTKSAALKKAKCEVCGAFVCRSQLKRHMDVHNGVKNFSCTMCSKAFARKDALKIHMLRIHSSV